MPGSIYQEANSIATLLDDTGVAGNNSLTGLQEGKAAISGSPVDNTSRLDFWADFELIAYFTVAPYPKTALELYLLPSLDGTNYADGTAGSSPVLIPQFFIGALEVRQITTIHRLVLRRIKIPPLNFKIQIYNITDQTLAAQNTGSRLKVVTYRIQNN